MPRSILITLCLAFVFLAGCGNYTGEGNDFTITAHLVEVSHDAVRIDQITVEHATGEADGWFNGHGSWFGQDHLMVHNNFHNSDIWSTKTYVGHAFDAAGQEVPLEHIPTGNRARLIGKIRSDRSLDGKRVTYRAVFDQLNLLP